MLSSSASAFPPVQGGGKMDTVGGWTRAETWFQGLGLAMDYGQLNST